MLKRINTEVTRLLLPAAQCATIAPSVVTVHVEIKPPHSAVRSHNLLCACMQLTNGRLDVSDFQDLEQPVPADANPDHAALVRDPTPNPNPNSDRAS